MPQLLSAWSNLRRALNKQSVNRADSDIDVVDVKDSRTPLYKPKGLVLFIPAKKYILLLVYHDLQLFCLTHAVQPWNEELNKVKRPMSAKIRDIGP